MRSCIKLTDKDLIQTSKVQWHNMCKNTLELRNFSKFGKKWAINFQTKAKTIPRFGDKRQGDRSHIQEMYSQGNRRTGI